MRWLPALSALVALGCIPPLPSLPMVADPPWSHPDLGDCTITAHTTVVTPGPTPPLLATETWRYDADGRRVEVRYDDDADGEIDRVHRDRWGALAPSRTDATRATDEGYRFEARYRYEHTTLLSSTTETADGRRSVTYRYDLGLLQRIEEDDDDDGVVDQVATLRWDSPHDHTERREGRTIERHLDAGRLLWAEERPDDEEEPVVRTSMTWSAQTPRLPVARQVDLDDDGLIDVSTRWSHDCHE